MNTPLVSITMPAYNAGKYIKKAINSILLQTYKNWELIIVNDGSTDETLSVINSFEDSRIIVVSQENHGRGYSRNVALKMARGKYICFLDADDMISPNKLEKQVSILETNENIALVSTGMLMYVNNKVKYKTGEIFVGESSDFNNINCATSMIRAQTAKRISYDTNMQLGEDKEFFNRYLSIGVSSVYYLSDGLYFYNISDQTKWKMINYLCHGISVSIKKSVLFFFETVVYFIKMICYVIMPLNFLISRRYKGTPTIEEKNFFNYVCSKRTIA